MMSGQQFLRIALTLSVFACGNTARLVRVTALAQIPPPAIASDEYVQAQTRPVDLLFVIDNSASMQPIQQSVAENLESLFDMLGQLDIDFHIAVTSTDALSGEGPAQGRFSKYGAAAVVTRDTPNALAVLKSNVKLGASGASAEMPTWAARQALGLLPIQKRIVPTENIGFLREEARLGIVIVTNADDSSIGTYSELFFGLRDLKGRGNDKDLFLGVVAFDSFDRNRLGASWQPSRIPAAGCQTPSVEGGRYDGLFWGQVVANAPFDAALISICSNFAETLRSLALQSVGFERTYALKQRRDASQTIPCNDGVNATLCVYVNGKLVPKGAYAVSATGDLVTFIYGSVPSATSTIRIDYAMHSEAAQVPFPTREVVSAAQCVTSRDCAQGQICGFVSHTCIVETQCEVPNPLQDYAKRLFSAYVCPPTQACEAGACVEGCYADASCSPGSTCLHTDVGVQGKCIEGCDGNGACCAGDLCDSGKCIHPTGKLKACDTSLCVGGDSACRALNGMCVTKGNGDYGCVPKCSATEPCPGGYQCSTPFTLGNACTLGGNECRGGRVCSATLESPQGSCSCLSDAECGTEERCEDQGFGKRCYQKFSVCSPPVSCEVYFQPETPLLCRDDTLQGEQPPDALDWSLAD